MEMLNLKLQFVYKWFGQITIALVMVLFNMSAHAQNPWHSLSFKPNQTNKLKANNTRAAREHLVSSSPQEIKNALNNSPTLTLPLPDGTFSQYRFEINNLLPASLKAKYPNILTYTATDINNPQNQGNFTLSSAGLYGLFTHNHQLVLLDKKAFSTSQEVKPTNKHSIEHTSYYASQEHATHNKSFDKFLTPPNHSLELANQKPYLASPLRKILSSNMRTTYTIAISATGEYTQAVGGTKEDALDQIVRTLSAINTIYEQDLNIRFKLASNNDKLIFTNSETDPFTNIDASDDINTNQEVTDKAIGLQSIDLAHLFATGGGGLAYVGICEDNYKARAVSGFESPNTSYFNISLVAHEIGHQLGASHSFNGTQGACAADSRNGATAWEPGSGSTIMSYAGLCESQNLPTKEKEIIGTLLYQGSDKLFHVGSIEEIKKHTNTSATCGTQSTETNNAPTADAGVDYTIPIATSFKLTGSASDADGDKLTYIWEQFQQIPKNSALISNPDDLLLKPLFRSYTPTSSLERHFPSLIGALTGTLAKGEAYATSNRKINLNFTVRDGRGGVATDQTTITTQSTCPFAILYPTSKSVWHPGKQNKVLWDTAASDKAPINCSKVDISLDTGDASFSKTLLKGTVNSGVASINVPNLKTNKARIMVSCSDNVFYAINSGNFKITSNEEETQPTTTKNIENTCNNPITINNISTTPPATDPTPEIDKAPANDNHTSGGSGGGAIPAWLAILIFTAATLSACKSIHVDTNTQNTKSSSLEKCELSLHLGCVKSDVDKSIKQGDFRLWATSSRAPFILGISPQMQQHFQLKCGIRYLPNTSDQLNHNTNMDQLTQKQKMRAYAAAYNKTMMSHCLKQGS